jgi:holo-[acyl-carrier protein] synthase
MIKGVGTDLVEIARIKQSLESFGDKFSQRILAPSELISFQQSGVPENFVAKRFAAKEAAGKALGTGIGQGISWHDFTIEHDEWGAPLLLMTGKAAQIAKNKGITAMNISISDERHYALAFVVLS